MSLMRLFARFIAVCATGIVLAPPACAQSGHSEWVEEDDVSKSARQPAPYVKSPDGVMRQQQPLDDATGLIEVPSPAARVGSSGAGGAPAPQFGPSQSYQQLYQKYFANDAIDQDGDDDGSSTGLFGRRRRTAGGGSNAFIPFSGMPGANVGPYNTYGNGQFATPYSSGSVAGMQSGFGAPMFAGTELPNPYYMAGPQAYYGQGLMAPGMVRPLGMPVMPGYGYGYGYRQPYPYAGGYGYARPFSVGQLGSPAPQTTPNTGKSSF